MFVEVLALFAKVSQEWDYRARVQRNLISEYSSPTRFCTKSHFMCGAQGLGAVYAGIKC